MAAKVMAIAREEMALGLGLTGVPVQVTGELKEVERIVEELIEAKTQMVILDEYYRDKFSETFSIKLQRHSGLPLVIFCPAFAEEKAGTDAYINAILRPAVGFEIRLG